MVASWSPTPPGGPWPSGVVGREQVVAVSCTGQWASTVPVDAAGRPVGDCLLWIDTRGGPLVRRAVGRPGGGLRPAGPVAAGSGTAAGAPSTSGADPIGHILYLEHEQPDVAARGPVVPRAGRLPVHALHRGGRGRPRVDGRGLAHRQPPARAPRLRPRAGRRVRGARREAAAAGADRLAWSARCSPEVAGDARAARPGSRWSPARPTSTPPRPGPGRSSTTRPTWPSRTTTWISCPVPMKKTDPSGRSPPCPGFVDGLHLVANNQDTRRRGARLAARAGARPMAASRPPSTQLTALAGRSRPGQRRRHLHALAGRRALARRRPHGPGRVPQPVARGPPGPSWCAPSSRAWPSTPAGCSRPSSASWDSRSARSGRSAGAPRPLSGARSTPTCSAGPSSRWPTPANANLRGSAAVRRPGARARCAPRRSPPLVPVEAVHQPDPADRHGLRPAVRRVPRALLGPERRCSPASTDPGDRASARRMAERSDVRVGGSTSREAR